MPDLPSFLSGASTASGGTQFCLESLVSGKRTHMCGSEIDACRHLRWCARTRAPQVYCRSHVPNAHTAERGRCNGAVCTHFCYKQTTNQRNQTNTNERKNAKHTTRCASKHAGQIIIQANTFLYISAQQPIWIFSVASACTGNVIINTRRFLTNTFTAGSRTNNTNTSSHKVWVENKESCSQAILRAEINRPIGWSPQSSGWQRQSVRVWTNEKQHQKAITTNI